MTSPFGRQHRLAQRGGAGLVCDEAGLALGCAPLAVIEEGAGRRYRVRPADEISRALRLAYDAQPDEIIERYSVGLQRVVALLEAGETGRAGVQAVLLGLPEISPEGMAKLAAAEGMQKAGWKDQPRVPAGQAGGGEWTSTGAGSSDAHSGSDGAHLEQVAFHGVTPAEKAAYVRQHLADALSGAKTLGVPVENILGLSALESAWGQSRFAADGKNFFGLHYPSKGSGKPIQAEDNPKVKMSSFENYGESLKSFIFEYGGIVRGKIDPIAFAEALQDSKKFGIDPDTGEKVPGYVAGVAGTIRHLRPFISDLTI